MHCFDGFRTSHEMQRIEALDYEDLRGLVDYEALKDFRRHALNPEHPTNRGNNVNPDVYFQCKEGANEKSCRHAGHGPALHGRDQQAHRPGLQAVQLLRRSRRRRGHCGDVLRLRGCCKETVDYLNANGRKVGMVQIHLYRPFSVQALCLPPFPLPARRSLFWTATRRPAPWASLCIWTWSRALNQAGRTDIKVVGGRYGLSSKDTTPGQFIAVYDNLKQETPKNNFTIGINRRRDPHLPGL